MSKSPAVGVIPVQRGEFMALTVRDDLRGLAAGAIGFGDIHPGAWVEAKEFLNSAMAQVLQDRCHILSENPPASINDWLLAQKAYLRIDCPTFDNLTSDSNVFVGFVFLCLSFNDMAKKEMGGLTIEQRRVARDIAKFFDSLLLMARGEV